MEEMEVLRTEDDVDRIMAFAKLEKENFLKPVQCISFDTDLDNECVQLIEVDNAILSELQEGNRVCIRGQSDDSAVLCTSCKTYDLKLAETSNTLLLLPDLQLSDQLQPASTPILHTQVKAMKYTYYEVKPIRARIKRIQTLLEINEYSGWEYEKDDSHQGKKYTFDELQQQVQASDKELTDALKDLQACEIDGYWRILHFDFMVQVVEEIIRLIDEQSWTVDAVPMAESADILGELYPKNVVKHVLMCIGDEVEDSPGNYRLNEDKICRMYAEIILKPSDKFQLDEFLSMWQQSVPSDMTTSLYQLEGLALMDKESHPAVVWYFPVSRLPEAIEDRFNMLFREKPKWTLDEITPYIVGLTTGKLSVGAMLMKFARASTHGGIKVYNSKKPLT